MTTQVWCLYVTTILVMMSTPGPSHLLMLSNSISHGFKKSLATAAGDLSANILQMLAAGLGLAAILMASKEAFTLIKWVGVAYLIYMGIQLIWRARETQLQANTATVSLTRLWFQGFITSASNPKAVVFFAALFPQFIAQSQSFWPQFLILSVTYICIDGLFLGTYGMSAGWVARKLQRTGRVWLDRLGGSLLIFAAVALGAKNISD